VLAVPDPYRQDPRKPLTGQALRRLSTLLIVSAASGCDNVEWGGISVRLQDPPAAVVGATPDSAPSTAEVLGQLPEGAVLYVAERDSSGLHLIPVGGVQRDSVTPFPSETEAPGYRARFAQEKMPPGAEFVLFAKGVRVGSFTVQSVATDESFCVARPVATGIVELTEAARAETRFLAIPREAAVGRKWSEYAPVEMDRPQRDASLSLPLIALAQAGAERPPNILDNRWDMQAFRPEGQSAIWFAGTYLIRDRLQVERPPPTAYSLFLVGAPNADGTSYSVAYAWYRPYWEKGKGAPVFVDQFDWDADGQTEILLEVLGENHRWFAALDQRGGSWTLIHEDPCGRAAPAVVAVTAPAPPQ
jgi:hypothetical protein